MSKVTRIKTSTLERVAYLKRDSETVADYLERITPHVSAELLESYKGLDEIKANLEKMYEAKMMADREIIRQRLIADNEKHKDARKTLDEMYAKNMAKLRGE